MSERLFYIEVNLSDNDNLSFKFSYVVNFSVLRKYLSSNIDFRCFVLCFSERHSKSKIDLRGFCDSFVALFLYLNRGMLLTCGKYKRGKFENFELSVRYYRLGFDFSNDLTSSLDSLSCSCCPPSENIGVFSFDLFSSSFGFSKRLRKSGYREKRYCFS